MKSMYCIILFSHCLNIVKSMFKFLSSGSSSEPLLSVIHCPLLRSWRGMLAAPVPSLMYKRNVLLFHLPSVCIVESSTPSIAVVVATPTWKLCPTYFWAGRPTLDSARLTSVINCVRVSGDPSFHWKRALVSAPSSEVLN